MFKKPQDVAVRSRTLLKNKDSRKLRADVSKAFPTLGADELDLLIPPKEKLEAVSNPHAASHRGLILSCPTLHELSKTKMSNRAVVYGIKGKDALFIDSDGRGDWFPTVYALWLVPTILPTLLVHAPVSQVRHNPTRMFFTSKL
jgi:translation initiation factor 2D